MSISGPAIASALNALRRYSRDVDWAAHTIAAAGLTDLPAEPNNGGTTPGAASPSDAPVAGDLASAMTSMLLAQRAFSAQLRVLRTADEMLKESVDVVGRR